MKNLKIIPVVLAFLLLCIHAKSQQRVYTLSGVIQNPKNNSFAYLIYSDKARTISKTKIEKSKFVFKLKENKAAGLFQTASIYLSNRGDISSDEFSAKINSGILKLDGPNVYMVVIEDISLDIENGEVISEAKITSGGKLTKEYSNYAEAVRSGKFNEFVSEHPNSPLSLNMIDRIVDFKKTFKNNPIFGPASPSLLFKKLSPSSQNTLEGKKLLEKINANGM